MSMDRFKDWIIEKLGGITYSEQLRLKRVYESWISKNLTGRDGKIVVKSTFYNPYYGDDILVISSNTRVLGGSVKGIQIAPWCTNVVAGDVRIIEDYDSEGLK